MTATVSPQQMNPQSVSELLGTESKELDELGVFDAHLRFDSRLYIDPELLKHSSSPIIAASYEKVIERFSNIMRLLSHSNSSQDRFWREANDLCNFKELPGLGIGYGESTTTGSGLGPKYVSLILHTVKELIDAGATDPAIFELVGILEKGVGADRISDMIAQIIVEDVVAYSAAVFSQFSLEKLKTKRALGKYLLPINPHNSHYVLLLPQDILRPLPIAQSYDEISNVCAYNAALRNRVNSILGKAYSKMSVTRKKETIKQAAIANPKIIEEISKLYQNTPPPAYDFTGDPLGEVAWYKIAKEYTSEHPLSLTLAPNPTPEQIHNIVIKIIVQFKKLIENNGLYELLYDDTKKGQPLRTKREGAAQKLLYGIGMKYCEENNIDLTAEPEAGRGPADFKFSIGYSKKSLAEIKLTTNSSLLHGYKVQLEEYKKAENATRAVYVVVHVLGGSLAQLKEVVKIVKAAKQSQEEVPDLLVIDARPKLSASKYQPRASLNSLIGLEE